MPVMRPGRVPGWVRGFLALIVALAAIRGLEWIIHRASPAGEIETVRSYDLRRWDLLGCWDLRVEPWAFSPYVAAIDSADRAGLAPPGRLLLLPDSLDEWGRAHGTLRAALLDGGHDERLVRSLRWFVRADTLWLVWSADAARAGIALFARGDSLLGQALALRSDSAEGTATAAAWRINCSTQGRERRAGRPRR